MDGPLFGRRTRNDTGNVFARCSHLDNPNGDKNCEIKNFGIRNVFQAPFGNCLKYYHEFLKRIRVRSNYKTMTNDTILCVQGP